MKRADDVVACGVADDVDDVGNTQGSVGEVGCVDSEGGGGKDPPPLPPGHSRQGTGSSTERCYLWDYLQPTVTNGHRSDSNGVVYSTNF